MHMNPSQHISLREGFKKIKSMVGDHMGGSNHTRILFPEKKSEKLLNAQKHILYIMGNFLIDICCGTLGHEVPEINLTSQKLVVVEAGPSVGFNRQKKNSPLYTFEYFF